MKYKKIGRKTKYNGKPTKVVSFRIPAELEDEFRRNVCVFLKSYQTVNC